MKGRIILASVIILLTACGHHSGPDVSGIAVHLSVERFDKAFFSIDTNEVATGLDRTARQDPPFYNVYMQEVLGVDPNPATPATQSVTRQFLSGYRSIYDSLQRLYADASSIQSELQSHLRYLKYYFPDYPVNKLVLFLGPFDAPGVAVIEHGIAIGLQHYAGRNFSVYQSEPMQAMFASYITRRFDRSYLAADCMKALLLDLFPDNSGSKPLLEQMVEKGKQWWLLDKVMPATADSLKTGYTQAQLDWCTDHEGAIWSYLVKNEDLNSINNTVIQTYIGDAPFTQGLSQEESPGNIGQWIGWQIVKKYVSKHPGIQPAELMKTSARTIIDEAKYKPK